MKRILPTVLGLTLLATACADPVAPAAPTPVPATITEAFSDTLIQAGSNTHLFTVQQIGGLKVSISDVSPAAEVVFGVGTKSLVSCTLISQVKFTPGAPATTQLSGTATTTGDFCVMVYDAGTLAEPVTYTVTVLHS